MAELDAGRGTGWAERIGVLVPATPGRGAQAAAAVVVAELGRRLPGRSVEAVEVGHEAGFGPVVVDERLALPAPAGAAVRVPLAEPDAESRPPVASLLADRLYPIDVLAARAAQLRLLGVLPPAGPLLVAAYDGGVVPDGEAVALAGLAFAERLGPVLADTGTGLRRIDAEAPAQPAPLPGPSDLLDLAAAVSVAGLVVADEPALAALGVAFGRPTVALGSRPTPPGSWPAGAVVVDALDRVAAALGPARARAGDPAERQPARDRLDAALDATAATLREIATEAQVPLPADPGSMAERYRLLEAAYDGLQRRVRAERLAFGAVATDLLTPSGEDDRQRLWVRLLSAEDAKDVAEEKAATAHTVSTGAESTLVALSAAATRQESEMEALRVALADAERRAADGAAELAALRSSRTYELARAAVRFRSLLRRRAGG